MTDQASDTPVASKVSTVHSFCGSQVTKTILKGYEFILRRHIDTGTATEVREVVTNLPDFTERLFGLTIIGTNKEYEIPVSSAQAELFSQQCDWLQEQYPILKPFCDRASGLISSKQSKTWASDVDNATAQEREKYMSERRAQLYLTRYGYRDKSTRRTRALYEMLSLLTTGDFPEAVVLKAMLSCDGEVPVVV